MSENGRSGERYNWGRNVAGEPAVRPGLNQRGEIVVKLYSKVVMLVLLMVLISASGIAWGSVPSQDDIGTFLSQPDGSRITLACEEIYRSGRSGRSFAIKEFCEPQPAHPRLVVVSTSPLPVSPYWTCDLSGVLSSFSGTSRNGSAINQRVLVVSPDDVLIYCDQKGRPFLFPPLKGLGIEWADKRSLAELAGDSLATSSRASAMDTDSLPPMPDALDSASAPVYCETIGDAEAEYSSTERNLVELQCHPFSGATSTQFTLGQDDPADSIAVHYTGSSSLGTGRINKIVGTIQKDISNNYWIEVDSGPNWTDGDTIGSVQTAPEGGIAWVKTLPEGGSLPSYQQNTSNPPLVEKVVSRVFPGQGYFYVEEPSRANGIRVADSTSALTLNPGDVVTIHDGDVTTVDGERAINSYYTEFVSSGSPPSPVGLVNKALGGGTYNTYTSGPVGGSGLNNVGLLVRAWGKVTTAGDGYYYIDDGSALNDGSGNTGVRVEGAIGYMPSADDYVAINAISGLTSIASSTVRTLRLASIADFSPMTPVKPQDVSAIATGSDKVTVYWPASPGATGYNVYMGTDFGEEDYDTPINAAPVTQPIYTGSNMYSFTRAGLSDTLYYFFTVKAVVGSTESAPSDEAIASPYSGAIPWDGCSPAAITEAVRIRTGIPYGDYQLKIRVCGPDGRIYSSSSATPLAADGSVIDGTNLLQAPGGDILPLSADWMTEGTSQMALLEPTTLGQSDGPYRRVKSIYGSENVYVGSQGSFYLPNGNAISLHKSAENRDTPYVYLGHHLDPAETGVNADVEGGVFYNPTTSYGDWSPYMWGSVNGKRYDAARYFLNIGKGIKYMAGTSIFMRYFVDYDQTYLVVDGYDSWWNEVVSILANPYPIVTATGGQMKRCESIAQGALHGKMIMRRTGSHIWGNSCSSMTLLQLYDGYIYSVPWSEWITQESGSYPAKGLFGGMVIDWTETNPYVQEDDIDINL